MYEGDFVNGKFEGYGKCIFKTDYYYVGQWKDGFRHGKGTLYYPNGNIKYEGDFVNDEKEGNGKYIFETGYYYIDNGKIVYFMEKELFLIQKEILNMRVIL